MKFNDNKHEHEWVRCPTYCKATKGKGKFCYGCGMHEHQVETTIYGIAERYNKV